MADMDLKVSPTKMKEFANETQQIYRTIYHAVNEIQTIERTLKNVWVGDSSELFVNTWAQLNESAKPMIENVEKHMKTLNELADIYLSAEELVKLRSQDLPTDGVPTDGLV